jgi:sugar/nucleoside kinase (ribokinase family)
LSGNQRRFDLVVVGHLALDQNIMPTTQSLNLGGPPAYAMIARSLGFQKVGLVTKVGTDFPQEYVDLLLRKGMDLEGLKRNEKTTKFVNHYDTSGRRTQQLTSVAASIHSSDIPPSYWDTRWMHISPIIQEVDTQLFRNARQNNIQVSVDIQGFVRCRASHDQNQIEPCSWQEFAQVADHIAILKSDVAELHHLTQISNLEQAAQSVHDRTQGIILITDGPAGSFLYHQSQLFSIPALPPKITIDYTGCGDVYSIGFLVEFERTNRPLWSAYFAAASASFNVETPGPSDFPTRSLVIERLQNFLSKPENQSHAELLLTKSENGA